MADDAMPAEFEDGADVPQPQAKEVEADSMEPRAVESEEGADIPQPQSQSQEIEADQTEPRGGEAASPWVEYVDGQGATYYCNVVTGETSWSLPSELQPPDEDEHSDRENVLPDSDPIDPIEPIEPIDPIEPIEPIKPIEPIDPTEPIEPIEPIETIETIETIDPIETIETTDPIQPIQPTDSIESIDAIQPINPIDPIEAIETIDPTDPDELIQPIDPVGAIEPPLAELLFHPDIIRLDPIVQQHVEAARRRRQGDSDIAITVREEERHWVAMFDPTQGAFYYYAADVGELTWTRPDGDICNIDGDPILRAVVQIQCAYRSQRARRRVFDKKLLVNQTASPSDGENDMRETGDVVAEPSQTLVWVEVFDPVQQVQYYFCSSTGETRWDPPTQFVSAAEDKQVNAAIAIQALARGRRARRYVDGERHVWQLQQKVAEHVHRQLEYVARPEVEREAMCRRELLDQEAQQIRGGDRFWGLDLRDQEVRRQLAEEALLASAELFWQRVNHARRQQRGGLDWRSMQQQEQLKLQRENEAETQARGDMHREEQLQRQFGDGFWGIQAEERCEAAARLAMRLEEVASRAFGDELNEAALYAHWADEATTAAAMQEKRRVVQEKRHQSKYMRWFYDQCTSVDDLLDYAWPTQLSFPVPPLHLPGTPDQAGRSPTKKDTNRKSYMLDDLVVRDRLERGDLRFGHRSILTIHLPNAAQIDARKGRFDITSLATGNVFDTAAQPNAKPPSMSPTRTKSPHKKLDNEAEAPIRYRRSKTPDPHLPARFNGVPFSPSQMSPTREILCGDHRKLTQLPSLPTATSKKPLKKKPKASPTAKANSKKLSAVSNNQESPRTGRTKTRHQSAFNYDSSTVDLTTTSYGFLSPFALGHQRDSEKQQKRQEENGNERDPTEDDEQQVAISQQFETRERAILAQVFAWMDQDGSGTVDRHEMAWALAHDHELLELSKASALLRLMLKQRSLLDELFSQLDSAATTARSEPTTASDAGLSWDVFVVLCHNMYGRLVSQGALALTPDRPEAPQVSTEQDDHSGGELHDDVGMDEERTIRRVFSLLDADGNGILERREICTALFDVAAKEEMGTSELSALIATSRALQPLLHESLFMKAFTSFESADPDGISEEEFVAFCLEIAEVAAINHLS